MNNSSKFWVICFSNIYDIKKLEQYWVRLKLDYLKTLEKKVVKGF